LPAPPAAPPVLPVAIAPLPAPPSSATGASAAGAVGPGVPRGNKAAALFGYSNEDNPYGDASLSETFVWGKKIAKELVSGKRDRLPTKAEALLERDALMDEIERARLRRTQREQEREEMERLRAEEARLRDAAQYAHWEREEDEFQWRQARNRCLIRVRDRREKAVDLLLKNRLLADAEDSGDLDEGSLTNAAAATGANGGSGSGSGSGSDPLLSGSPLAFDMELAAPLHIFAALSLPELEELQTDLEAMQEAEAAARRHPAFPGSADAAIRGGSSSGGGNERERRLEPLTALWECLGAVCRDEIARAVAREQGLAEGMGAGSLQAVDADIDALFAGKGVSELQAMQAEIKEKLRVAAQIAIKGPAAAGPGQDAVAVATSAVDADYWESVLAHAKVAEAKASLLAMHRATLQRRLNQLHARRNRTPSLFVPGLDEAAMALAHATTADLAGPRTASAVAVADDAGWGNAVGDGGRIERADALAESSIAERLRAAQAARASDESLMDRGEGGKALPSGEAEADAGTEMEVQLPADPKQTAYLLAEAAAAAGISAAAVLNNESFLASARFKPRKPRFFNRVKTGYDWNKYNQTHYDKDNPPPKTVQGYKFNIFYPDLIDKSKTPKYVLEPADSDEFCIIRFQGGAPYEDIAFKIVNREWELDRKRGFRCVFDRGILQLHFNFKRQFYRK
jgi:hypothetical protein